MKLENMALKEVIITITTSFIKLAKLKLEF